MPTFENYLNRLGGLMRFINRDLYLDGERSFRELAITSAAARCGIPTVEVLAAVSIKAAGPLYRCFLFTRELPGCIDLPMTRRDIGESIGLTIETVSRKLGELEDMGAIIRKGKRGIALRDAQLLQDISGR